MFRYRPIVTALIAGFVFLFAILLWATPQPARSLAAGTVNPILLYSWQQPIPQQPDSAMPESTSLAAQPATLVQGSSVFFTGPFTQTLYVSNGSASSTHGVALPPGVPGTQPLYAVLSQTLFLVAAPPTQIGVYRINDAQTASERVKVLQPEGATATLNDALIFTTWSNVDGLQLWRSNGSDAGTTPIKSLPSAGILTGTSDVPRLTSQMTRVGNFVFFFVQNTYADIQGWSLWRSDGTPDGTIVLQSFTQPKSEDSTAQAIQVGATENTFVFVTRENFGFVLKSTAGMPGDIVTLRNNPHTYGGKRYLYLLGSTPQFVFFRESDRFPNESVLWRTDGSINGTFALNVQIDPAASLQPIPLPNNKVAFIGRLIDVPPYNRTYISTDGTLAGTKELKLPCITSAALIENDHGWYAGGLQGLNEFTICRTDGTEAGSEIIYREINPQNSLQSPLFLGRTATHAFLQTITQDFQQQIMTARVWAIPLDELRNASPLPSPSPTPTLTPGPVFSPIPKPTVDAKVGQSIGGAKIIFYGRSAFYPCGLISNQKANNGPFVWFRAPAPGDAGCVSENTAGLWRSNGTITGTVAFSITGDIAPVISAFNPATVQGRTLYVLGNDLTAPNGLYRINSNRQAELLRPGLASGSVALNDVLLFALREHPLQQTFLWRSDGTISGTSSIASISRLPFDPRQNEQVSEVAATSERAFLVVATSMFSNSITINEDSTLWSSDGTASGTQALHTFTFISSLYALDKGVIFFAKENNQDWKTWFSDGTPAGTHPLETPTFQLIYPTTATGHHLAFFLQDSPPGAQIYQLWRTDGTVTGTQALAQTTLREHLAVLNDRAFFFNRDKEGLRLWRSDGTLSNTIPLTTFLPPVDRVLQIIRHGDQIYMLLGTVNGPQLWKSDGTAEGTRKVRSWFWGYTPLSGFSLDRIKLFSAGNTLLLESSAALYDLPINSTIPEWKVWVSLTRRS